MWLILGILLAVVLALFIGVLVRWLFLLRSASRLLARSQPQLAALITQQMINNPGMYELTPIDDDAAGWDETCEARAQDLARAGFDQAGRFTIPAIPGAVIAGFASQSQSLFAAVVSRPEGEPYTDIVSTYDDRTFTDSSREPEEGIPFPIWLDLVNRVGAQAPELIEAHLARRPSGFLAATSEDFAEVYSDIVRRATMEAFAALRASDQSHSMTSQ